MGRVAAALFLLLAAAFCVVSGTQLRDRAARNEAGAIAAIAHERLFLTRYEAARAEIAKRPNPFRGCPDANPQKLFVACYECLGRLKNVAIAIDDLDGADRLGEIEGRLWECRRAADVQRMIGTLEDRLAALDVELAEARKGLRRANAFIFASFALAVAALARALVRR